MIHSCYQPNFSCSHSGDAEATADVIPVDVTVNVLIASAWFTATQRPDATVVYNCTTGTVVVVVQSSALLQPNLNSHYYMVNPTACTRSLFKS